VLTINLGVRSVLVSSMLPQANSQSVRDQNSCEVKIEIRICLSGHNGWFKVAGGIGTASRQKQRVWLEGRREQAAAFTPA
jgi:hypothetical protein